MVAPIINIAAKTMGIILTFALSFLLSSVNFSGTAFIVSDYQHKVEFFKPAIKKLLKSGVDTSFIYSLLSNRETKFNERFVKINITGYLKKVDYSFNYNTYSVRKTKDFINENLDMLQQCEQTYHVPKEVIAALLWVETKHGSILGESNVVSVFMSTAMADQPQFIRLNKRTLREEFTGDTSELHELEKKIASRATKKSDWAIRELVALSKMEKQKKINVRNLRGSWAGAFGLSQFLPSSYVKFAVDGNGDGRIDLFELDDAVYSVANYLKKNGWEDAPESHEKALYAYNNSSAYVSAILKLAGKVSTNNTTKKAEEKQL
jgi:membrane-bound lytic murein transglycosylase B